MNLTPEQQALKNAAMSATPGPWHWADNMSGSDTKMAELRNAAGLLICNFGDDNQHDPGEGTEPDRDDMDFMAMANPAAILELFADLAQCNEDYGQAVDSVAQLQDEVFAVRAQVGAQAVPVDPPTITLNFERPRMWHMGCKVSHLGGNVCKTISHDPANSLVECRACGKRGRYPVGAVGERVVAEESGAPAQTGTAESALQELADQAQELGMGYEGMVMPSPPGSAGSGEQGQARAFEKWALTSDGNCNLNDLRKRPVSSNGDTYFSPLVERDWEVWKAAEAALSQPVQAVPDEELERAAFLKHFDTTSTSCDRWEGWQERGKYEQTRSASAEADAPKNQKE